MTRRPSPLTVTYALVALLAAATLTLPGARTTIAAGLHVIPAAAEPFTDWRVLFLLACLVPLGVVVRRRYYVAGWWR
ncbi:MAG: hypothetical protein EOP24_39050 [Hyphomicrobiales bacterium]|nr:MAG: hypothetical protein EOP24_39050 [Hyphomicrobiales bacterium]